MLNFFNDTDDLFYVFNHNLQLLDINTSAKKIHGDASGNFSMRSFSECMPVFITEPLAISCNDSIKVMKKKVTTVHNAANNRWYEFHIYPDEQHISILGIDITERQQKQTGTPNISDDAIRVANERFTLATLATNDMIWDWNLLTDELWWNANYNRFFGFDDSTAKHSIHSWIDRVHPDDHDRVKKGIYEVVQAGKKSWNDEYRYLGPDKTYLDIFDRGYVAHDENGKPIRMIGSMLDITERRKAENELRISEEKYRSLVEQASDAIFIADENGRFLTVNSSACKLSQYTEQEIMNMTFYDFAVKAELEKFPLRIEELRKGLHVVTERTLVRKNKQLVPIEISAKMLSDHRLLVIIRDISDRVKARNELLREKNLSDAIINSLPGIFYQHDDKGNMLRWNNNFETITGYAHSEIEHAHPLSFYHVAERELLLQRARDVLQNGNANVEANIYTKTQSLLPYFITGTRFIFEGTPSVIVIGYDISEKRKAAELLQKSYENTRRLASHLATVRDEERRRIGREIHDELGQQLTAVKMDIAWINKKIDDSEPLLKQKIGNMIRLLDDSNHSVRRIISELSPAMLDKHGLPEAIERLNEQFTKTSGIPIRYNAPGNQLSVPSVIANCIFRVYQESLTNIMRYAKATAVETRFDIQPHEISLQVHDNGVGFDANAERNHESFGLLGMQERVLALTGSFALTSAPGKGTSIALSIPINNVQS